MELQTIQSKIYEIRGMKVMLDFDLADLYGVETKVLKQAVRRNIHRFPADFMFELTSNEHNSLIDSLRSQFVTSNRGGTRYNPFAFTEQGVAMLASVLSSPQAIEINIQIVRAFVVLRQYALGYAELNQKLEEFMIETSMQFSDVYQVLAELANQKKQESKLRKRIGFRRDE